MIILPPGLTEDEEALQKKFAKLKKKKKALLALKKQQGSTSQATQGGIKRSISDQPVVDTATATEQAKMLVKTGAITAIKAENKNSGFKRSRTLEGKLKDPEKGTTLTFQPFQRSISADDDYQEARRPHRKFLYKRGFVRSSDHFRDPEKELDMERDPDRESDRSESPHSYESDYDRDHSRDRSKDNPRDKDKDRDRDRDRNFHRSDSYPDWPTPRKGNTLYVHGAEMTQAMLETTFSPFGNIIDLTMDNLCNCAFITFEKIESADEAITQLNGTMVENVQLTVSVAREQPMLGVAVGNSLWGALAVMNSVKGSHQDKRTQIEYKEDVF